MDVAVVPAHQQLKDAREQAVWSLERLALALNLTVTVLEHLEAGEYCKLPKGPYVAGYIRAYANQFDLDAESLVAQYLSENAQPGVDDFQEPEMHNAKLTPRFEHKKHRTLYGLAAAVLMVVGLAVYSVLQAAPIKNEVAYQEHQQKMLQQTKIVKKPSNTSVLAASVIPAAIAAPVELSQPHDGLLAMRFSADCWVEVKDAEGELIVSSVKKADESLELSGEAPFHVTLGYAPAVMLSYNGKPVEFEIGRNNIVHLVVGNT